MKLIVLALFSFMLSTVVLADDFVSVFMSRCVEDGRPLNNVNIGRSMLEKMASRASDEQLKNAFKELNSIRMVSSDNLEDSKYYYRKAKELIRDSFGDYQEALSVSEVGANVSVWMKRFDEDKQDLILIALDNDGKLSIITFSGKIDFDSISKLFGSLQDGQQLH